MAQTKIIVPDVGEVTIAKKRGNRNMRLSITSKGTIRVSIPAWTPFRAGAVYAQKHKEWIKNHLSKVSNMPILSGSKIGKNHKVFYINNLALGSKVKTQITDDKIVLTSGLPIEDETVQSRLITACEKSLRQEAQLLLPSRLDVLASKYGYKYRKVTIKKLTSRWGSCSKQGDISLSLYLMQIPWRLIDYVLVHELAHTVHQHHQSSFWDALESAKPGAKQLRAQIRQWRPQIMPS